MGDLEEIDDFVAGGDNGVWLWVGSGLRFLFVTSATLLSILDFSVGRTGSLSTWGNAIDLIYSCDMIFVFTLEFLEKDVRENNSGYEPRSPRSHIPRNGIRRIARGGYRDRS